MAASENQGLQIALIIFVTLTVLLLVTSFVLFRSYEDYGQQVTELTEKSRKGDEALRTAQDEMNSLKAMIGAKADAKVADVDTAFKDDMKKYAAGLAAENQVYSAAAKMLFEALESKDKALSAAKTEVDEMRKMNEAREAIKKPQIDVAVTSSDKATKDLADERAKFQEALALANKKGEDLANKSTKLEKKLKDTEDDSAKDIKALEDELAKRDQLLAARNIQIDELTNPESFEVPDGSVTRINQRARTVWIDLGSADALRRQVMFSVFAADENLGGKAKRKGGIEVTKVLHEHLAEARILDDDLVDPIVPGDIIYTPLWHAGRSEHFALAGGIDLDKDSTDDTPYILDLISMNGGVLDAHVDGAGKRTGEMSVNTRYLIKGDEPDETSSKAAQGAFSKLVGDARRLGVRELTLDRFLDLIGWQHQQDLVRFGTGTAIIDTDPDAVDARPPRSRGNVTELFRERRPGTRAPKANGK